MQNSILNVYSSARSMRANFEPDKLLPKSMLMGEFFNHLIIVQSYRSLPSAMRLPLFMQAMKACETELTNHKFVFEKSFLAFLESSFFALEFFKELAAFEINIEDIPYKDIYGDYEDHLRVLSNLKKQYMKLLEDGAYYDDLILPENATIALNTNFITSFNEINIYLNGVMSPFHQKILTQASNIVPIKVHFCIDRYTQKLAFLPKHILQKCAQPKDILPKPGEYSVWFHNGEIIEHNTLGTLAHIKAYRFNLSISQTALVFAKIEEWIASGVNANDIVVIVPKADFTRYLNVLDVAHNLNYAMGKDITQTKAYKALQATLEHIESKPLQESQISEQDMRKVDSISLSEYVQNIIKPFKDTHSLRVREIVDEILFLWRDFNHYNLCEFLHLLLNELKGRNIDDVMGGKIKVMGVLEARGLTFQRVIIVDFNDNVIPHLQDSDIFLNSKLRKRLNMPTAQDKEQLQKHYYLRILMSAKEVAIGYVENDENVPSLMLEELGLKESDYINGDECFTLLPLGKEAEYVEDKCSAQLPKVLTPSGLKKLLECPRKYYFYYIESMDELGGLDNNAALIGNIVHLCLKDVYETEKNCAGLDGQKLYKKAIEWLDDYIVKESLDYVSIAKLEWLKYELKTFFAKDAPEGNEIEILDIERAGEVQCGRFCFKLRPDRIQRNGNSLEVIDYKYKQYFDIEKKPETMSDFALVLYGKFAREIYPQYAHLELKLYYWDIHHKDGARKVPENEAKNEALLERLLDGFNGEMVFEKTQKREPCRYCAFKILCNR